MESCPCGADHAVTTEVAASVRTAVNHGQAVTYDPQTGQHLWTIPAAGQSQTTAHQMSSPLDQSREEVSMSDEVQPVPETETAPGDGQADQVGEDEAVEQPVALLRPPPAYSGYVDQGIIVHP